MNGLPYWTPRRTRELIRMKRNNLRLYAKEVRIVYWQTYTFCVSSAFANCVLRVVSYIDDPLEKHVLHACIIYNIVCVCVCVCMSSDRKQTILFQTTITYSCAGNA